jgi:hypothetical protein
VSNTQGDCRPSVESAALSPNTRIVRLTALVVIHAVLWLLVMVLDYSAVPIPLPAGIAFRGIYLSQSILLAVWVGLGIQAREPRILVLVFGTLLLQLRGTCSLLSMLLSDAMRPGFLFEYFAYGIAPFYASTVLMAVAFALFRLRVAHLVDVSRSDEPGARYDAPWQYSLKLLLGITLGASILLGLSRLAVGIPNTLTLFGFESLEPSLLGSAVGICAAWATLSPGNVWSRMAITLALSAVGGALPLLPLVDGDPAPVLAQSAAWFVAALILVLTLLVVRSCGYRLVRNQCVPENQ